MAAARDDRPWWRGRALEWLRERGPPVPLAARPWSRADTMLAWGLALVVLLRWPLRSRHLATWDSVLFALGMERYDVRLARPHAPGYPVYVALGDLMRLAFPDPNDALVALSVLFTAAAAAVLYALLRHWCGRLLAASGAALLVASPIALYNSLIATTYPGEALLSALMALLAWRHLQAPTPRRAALLAATFALGLGLRQSLLFFLAPIVAYALLAAPQPWRAKARTVAVAAACALVAGLAWFVPMVAKSGGLATYLAATRLQSGAVVFALTVFGHGAEAWHDLWPRFKLYVAPETAFLLPASAACALVALLAKARPGWRKAAFLAAWALPALLFYLTIFNGWDKGPDGYILVLLPPLYAACVLALAAAARRLGVGGAVAAGVIVVVTLSGFGAAWASQVDGRIVDHDAWTDHWLGLSKDPRFAPNDTAILASYSWAHVKWHYPEYTVYSAMRIPAGDASWILTLRTRGHEDDQGFYAAHIEGPSHRSHALGNATRVVLFDFQVAGENGGPRLLRDDVEVKEAFLADGWRILYFDADPARPFIEDYFLERPNQPPAPPGA